MNDEKKESGNNQQSNVGSDRIRSATSKGLNAVTGGAWNKARNAPIIGKKLQDAEDKLADKIENSKLGRRVAKHQRRKLGAPTPEEKQQQNNPTDPNKPADKNNQEKSSNSTQNTTSSDVGPRNLRKSLANRARNIWNQRKKKKKKGDEDSPDNNKEKEDEKSSEEKEEKEDEESSSKEKTETKVKRKLIIRIAMFVLPAFLLLIVVDMIASLLTQSAAIAAPIEASKSYGTKDFEAVTDKDSKLYVEETNYYKKLKEVAKNNDDLNVNYINAILLLESMYADSTEEFVDSAGIDYKKMKDNVDAFVKLIKSVNSTDYELNGEIYNTIKNSEEFKNYYKDYINKLVEERITNDSSLSVADAKDAIINEILEQIFDLASELDYEEVDETVVTSETSVTTKETKTVGTKTETTTKTLSINDYIADSIYATTDNVSNSEMVKAYTVVYSTNIVSDNKKLSITSTNAVADNALCSIKEGCSYDDKGHLVSGSGKQNSKNINYYKGAYYYKIPLTEDAQKTLNKDINTVFGNVLVTKDGDYPRLDWSKLGGLGDGEGDYKKILSAGYGSEYNYKNVGENSYILDASYGERQVKTPVVFYDQKDYPNYKFCGLKNSTIAGSGCGVTSMAIVASTYVNKSYNPIYMNNQAKNMGACAYSGTYQSFFGREAKKLGLKYVTGSKYSKSFLNLVLKHLSQGHLVVVRMGSGHFTGGGHYMVLGGVDPKTKKVYVYDPNNRSNKQWRKTGNGWYSFNDMIVKEAYNFYIIWR